MPRPGKFERARPRAQSAVRVDVVAWRERVAQLLANQWDTSRRWAGAEADAAYDRMALVIVAMFDAGARNGEVERLLAQEEKRVGPDFYHEASERRAIVAALHRAAELASGPPSV